MLKDVDKAINWALQQDFVINDNKVDKNMLVDYVRLYFNDNNIDYTTFDFHDIKSFVQNNLLN